VRLAIGIAYGLAAIISFHGLAGGRPGVAAAEPSTLLLPPASVKADLADLYAGLKASHYDLYARMSRADYDRLYADMLADITQPITRDDAAERFQRFAAFGRVAHARMVNAGAAFATYRNGGGAGFPLAVRVRDNRIFVAGDRSGLDGIAPGDEILSLDGAPAADWLKRASRHVSADTSYMIGAMMEWEFPRVVWEEVGSVPRFALRIRKPDGRRVSLVVPARTRAEAQAALAGEAPQLDLSWDERDARMLNGGLAYLRPGPFYNTEGGADLMYDNRAFVAFIDKAFESFLAAGATDLLIDLRDNAGGDNSFSDHLVAWFADRPFRFNAGFRIRVSPATIASNQRRLDVAGNDPTGISAAMAAAYRGVRPGTIVDFPTPEGLPRTGARFTGRVYALINRHSYSNTVTVAALLQDYGFGLILGQETSDLATTFGAMESFTLPRTGLAVGYPKAFIVRPNGSTAARGVVPDIAISTPIVETPEDPVLRRAEDIVRRRAAAGAQSH
jgi:C-terminal processing protease CtpA/Prc